MENYNPRQNTMMRWKDKRELEKFSFFDGGFDVQDEILENVSQDVNWSKIANLFNNYDNRGVILYDSAQNFLFTGYLSGGYLYLYSADETGVTRVEITYDKKTDRMQINFTNETFISEDNVKTIFGQSISGTGNIELYRHQLTLHSDEAEYQDMGLIVYSSSNLNVDSLQDLTTLLKPNSNTLYFAFVIHSTNIETYKVIYDNNIWKMGYDDESTGKPNYVINSVSDIVTPI